MVRSYLDRLALLTDGKPTTLGWIILAVATLGLALFLAIVTALISAFTIDLPLPESAPGGQATEVLDANGDLVGALKGEQKRQIVPLTAIAEDLQNAVVATEDRGFYDHSGISYRGMVRALFTNVRAGEITQGGSTITQQYARNAFGRIGTERTLNRKLKEIVLARRIDDRYPKDDILGFYLNTIYFGRGAYGAEAAALTYFKKSASDLTLDEAAFLAGAIRAPERFQPDKDPDAVVRIKNEVLSDLVAADYLTQAEADQAGSVDLLAKFQLGPTQLDSARAGFFLEHVRRLLSSDQYDFSEAELLGGGLTIETGLELSMQDAAEAAIAQVLDQPDDPEAALIAMDPQGFVRAMVGGRDVADRVRALGFNYSANVRADDDGGRPAGSAFKPVALARYLEDGGELTDRFSGSSPMTIDAPRCRTADGEPWTVSNYGNQGYGQISLLQATASSVNTVYAQLMAGEVSPQEFVDTSQRLGLPIPDRDVGCALTLGTTPVTPLEMAVAYTTFAARGMRPEPILVTKVTGPSGEVLLENEPVSDRAVDEEVADTVNQALQRVVSSGTARGAGIGRPAAAKTGTTQNNRDAWLAGYTPDLAAVVWMGFAPDETGAIPEMNSVRGREVTGGSFPATIWRLFMGEALKNIEATDFVEPGGSEDDRGGGSDDSPDTPNPTPSCPPGTILTPNLGCEVIELPSPLPVPTWSPSPLPPRSPSPSPVASPTPTATPTPTPTPTPTGSPISSPDASPPPLPLP